MYYQFVHCTWVTIPPPPLVRWPHRWLLWTACLCLCTSLACTTRCRLLLVPPVRISEAPESSLSLFAAIPKHLIKRFTFRQGRWAVSSKKILMEKPLLCAAEACFLGPWQSVLVTKASSWHAALSRSVTVCVAAITFQAPPCAAEECFLEPLQTALLTSI